MAKRIYAAPVSEIGSNDVSMEEVRVEVLKQRMLFGRTNLDFTTDKNSLTAVQDEINTVKKIWLVWRRSFHTAEAETVREKAATSIARDRLDLVQAEDVNKTAVTREITDEIDRGAD